MAEKLTLLWLVFAVADLELPEGKIHVEKCDEAREIFSHDQSAGEYEYAV